jgi:hypothetical protein
MVCLCVDVVFHRNNNLRLSFLGIPPAVKGFSRVRLEPRLMYILLYSDPMSPINPHYPKILNVYAGHVEEYLKCLTTNSAGELISTNDDTLATPETLSEPMESIRKAAEAVNAKMIVSRIEVGEEKFISSSFNQKYRLTWSGGNFHWVVAGISISVVAFTMSALKVISGNSGSFGWMAPLIVSLVTVLYIMFWFITTCLKDKSS